MVPTYALLTLAVVALWLGGAPTAPKWRGSLWLVVLVIATGFGVWERIVSPLGVAWLTVLGVAAWAFMRPAASRVQLGVCAVVILVLCAGLMTHLLPGFENPRVLFAVRFSPSAVPFTLYLNFDKTAAGVLLLGFCYARIHHLRDWFSMIRTAAPRALAVMAAILVLSVAVGYVSFDPKIPQAARLWMWINLCFTCVAEEALFRGFIQFQLQRAWRKLPGGAWLALGVAALAFGLAHANGGALYVALATVAGVGYGWVFQRTQRIEASILTHFALNTAHFFLFTYPAIQR